MDTYEEIEWKCPYDKKKYRELVEKDRIYKFLLGLNRDLDEVRRRKFMLGNIAPAPYI